MLQTRFSFVGGRAGCPRCWSAAPVSSGSRSPSCTRHSAALGPDGPALALGLLLPLGPRLGLHEERRGRLVAPRVRHAEAVEGGELRPQAAAEVRRPIRFALLRSVRNAPPAGGRGDNNP